MVDITEATESAFINADLINGSARKQLVVVEEGQFRKGQYGKKFEVGVSLDGRLKTYSPSKETAARLAKAWGFDSKDWVEKKVQCKIVEKNNNEYVEGYPFDDTVKEETV